MMRCSPFKIIFLLLPILLSLIKISSTIISKVGEVITTIDLENELKTFILNNINFTKENMKIIKINY